MKPGFTDIHHHILYGLDDGPSTPEKMHAMLRHAADEGIVRIVATPHIVPGIKPFNMEKYRGVLEEAQLYCRENALDIEILPGAEMFYTQQCAVFLEDRRAPTMAGTNRVLVEFSPDISYVQLSGALAYLNDYGYVPILAHTERYRSIAQIPMRAAKLKAQLELYFQINARTILQPAGFFEKHFVKYMLDHELVDAVATDAHNLSGRIARMQAAHDLLAERCGAAYAKRLTDGSVLFDQ